jgi:hypothetical protein
MAQQTELTEFGEELVTDGGKPTEEALLEHFDPEEETVTEEWEGTYLYTSWGYDQTNVEAAQIVEVSDTGKTVLCRLVKKETVNRGKTTESVRPSSDQYGEEFRLHARSGGGEPVFKGSYPYIQGDPEKGKRKGSFFPWFKKAGDTIYQTAPGCGH